MGKIIALLIGIIIFILGLLFCLKGRAMNGLGYFLMIFSIFAGLAIANNDSIKFQWNNIEMQTMKSEIKGLRMQISQNINLKQNITQIVNNIVKVEVQKEIANLQDTLIQEDKARISEVFSKRDLDNRVKMVLPPDSQGPYAAALVIVELNKIPLKNSIVVQSQVRSFAGSAIQTFNNIVEMRFLKAIPPDILAQDTDFIEVSYIPDPDNKKRLYTLKGFKITFDTDQKSNIEGRFNFEVRN